MGINVGTKQQCKMTIYRDEQGRYKTYIKSTEVLQDGSTKDVLMSKKVQFRKDVHVRNKSVIEVIDGWIAPYRIPLKETTEEGKTKHKYLDKLFINEFNLLEDGIDENQKTKQYNKPSTVPQQDFGFNALDDDDLPF